MTWQQAARRGAVSADETEHDARQREQKEQSEKAKIKQRAASKRKQ